MKRTLLLIPLLLFGCSEPEPEVDWDAVDREIAVIEARLDTCLDSTPQRRHVPDCYERALIKIDDLARKYDIELDE
jgi:hypothetical protein